MPRSEQPEWEEDGSDNVVEMVENETSEIEMSEVLELLNVGNEPLPTDPRTRRTRFTRNAPVISTLRPILPKKLTLKSATWEPVSMIPSILEISLSQTQLGTKLCITGRRRWYGTNDIHNLPSTSTGSFMKPQDMYDQALTLTSSFKYSPGCKQFDFSL